MANRLRDFASDEPVFVDANIFIYHFSAHPQFGGDCTDFLLRIGRDEVFAVTSNVVISETLHFLQMQKGGDLLGTTNWAQVRNEIQSNAAFAKECWQAAVEGLDYVDQLQKGGLTIVDVAVHHYRYAAQLGEKYQLLVADSAHVYVCQAHGIEHFASNDADFDRVDFLTRWKPEP